MRSVVVTHSDLDSTGSKILSTLLVPAADLQTRMSLRRYLGLILVVEDDLVPVKSHGGKTWRPELV